MPDQMRFEHIDTCRIVATAAALDDTTWPVGRIALRIADDDVLLVGDDTSEISVADTHAIVEDDAGWSGAWLTNDEVETVARHDIHWQLPTGRPAFLQGLIAAIPAKLWLGSDGRNLLLVATVSVDEMQERLS